MRRSTGGTGAEIEWEPTRRRFIRAAGIGAVGLAGGAWTGAGSAPDERASTSPPRTGPLPPPIVFPKIQADSETESTKAPSTFAPNERVGFAIVGLGRLSLQEILPAMLESTRCKVTALVTGDAAKGARVAAQYGVDPKKVYAYAEFDRLRDDAAVDVVYVVLPNSMHEEYVTRAAKAGKHVLTEKPMATSVAEAERMVAACKAANRLPMVAYRIQYEPHHRLVRQLMRDGKLGAVKLIEMANDQAQGGDLAHWRLKRALAGGGSLPDVGIYCFNTARFLTGEEPVEITATQYSTKGDPRFREVEETVAWTMRFPSGILASCTTSYRTQSAKRYRVCGADAWAEMDPAFSYAELRLALSRKSAVAEGGEGREQISLPEKNQFALEMDHMADCVANGRRPFTPGEEGVQDHVVQAAIYEAAHTGRVVKLPAVATRDATRGPEPATEG
jgi:predicted dehydrogenase